MSPTIKFGDVVRTKEFHRGSDVVLRYDIVTFRSPMDTNKSWVMRIIALPGESVAVTTNTLFIDGIAVPTNTMPSLLRTQVWLTPQIVADGRSHRWILNTNEVFVIGDNLSIANDSRSWGPLNLDAVQGVVKNVRASYFWEVTATNNIISRILKGVSH